MGELLVSVFYLLFPILLFVIVFANREPCEEGRYEIEHLL